MCSKNYLNLNFGILKACIINIQLSDVFPVNFQNYPHSLLANLAGYLGNKILLMATAVMATAVAVAAVVMMAIAVAAAVARR